MQRPENGVRIFLRPDTNNQRHEQVKITKLCATTTRQFDPWLEEDPSRRTGVPRPKHWSKQKCIEYKRQLQNEKAAQWQIDKAEEDTRKWTTYRAQSSISRPAWYVEYTNRLYRCSDEGIRQIRERENALRLPDAGDVDYQNKKKVNAFKASEASASIQSPTNNKNPTDESQGRKVPGEMKSSRIEMTQMLKEHGQTKSAIIVEEIHIQATQTPNMELLTERTAMPDVAEKTDKHANLPTMEQKPETTYAEMTIKIPTSALLSSCVTWLATMICPP